MTNERALIESPVNRDPVIETKRRKLQLMEQMLTQFKRIDIQFLAIAAKDEGHPKFAILPLEVYQLGLACSWDGVNRCFNWSNSNGNFRSLFERKSSLTTSATATPADPIPDGVLATVDTVKGSFDRIMIAWEADWAAQPDGDPLVIGDIDGVWFLLAKWSTTELETFVAKDFTS